MDSSFLPAHPTLDSFAQNLFEKMGQSTVLSNSLPKDEEYKYYSISQPFKSNMKQLGQRVLSMINNFVQQEKSGNSINFEDSEDVLESYDSLSDVVDGLLERVVNLNIFRIFLKIQDTYCDEAMGIKKEAEIKVSTGSINLPNQVCSLK